MCPSACRLTAEEELQLGLRRGRSARAASPPLDLPPNRRVRRHDELQDSAGPSVEPSSERENAWIPPPEGQQHIADLEDLSASPTASPEIRQPGTHGSNGEPPPSWLLAHTLGKVRGLCYI